ncbi:MAG: hypothetical protein ACREU2_04715 [Steroidobacteraceae bacterium]
MKIPTVPILALGALALAAPLACLASPSSVAVQNCAQALATHLSARLAAVNEQPDFSVPIGHTQGAAQYILTARAARAPHGTPTGPMVCTVDRHGQVVSLRHPASTDTMPLLGTASQF